MIDTPAMNYGIAVLMAASLLSSATPRAERAWRDAATDLRQLHSGYALPPTRLVEKKSRRDGVPYLRRSGSSSLPFDSQIRY